jgi:hypothetical protein
MPPGGSFKGVVIAGHSKGGIQAAHRAFVEKDNRVKGVIAIGSRVKLDKDCDLCLRPIIEAIYQGIVKNPEIPLYQIIAENDWCAPMEATAVRPSRDVCAIIKKAMHLNVVYQRETFLAFDRFLSSALRV